MGTDPHDAAAEAERRRYDAFASFYACVDELMDGLDREQIDALSALVRPNGVRIPHGVWEAVRRDVGPERFSALIQHDRPTLIALARETWRAQRQAEEHQG